MELKPASVDAMFRAVELVHERLDRAASALDEAGIPYAVIGAHAVAAWVASADPAGVRNTPNVDLLARQSDRQRVIAAMNSCNFVLRSQQRKLLFTDGPQGRERSGLSVYWAGECVAPGECFVLPDLSSAKRMGKYPVIGLPELVTMKLQLHRTIDRVHVRDMIDVGLIDASWLDRLPADLATRLKHLLDTPNG